ncbi:hypothetical protein FXO37_01801 [Capsicum annuum]|nr:hypothetical protein FXO37_01801 [Capsicum annuum]
MFDTMVHDVQFLQHNEARQIFYEADYVMLKILEPRSLCFEIVSPEKILRLRVRDTKRALTQDASSEEVCVVMSGVIARFDGSDIQNILQRWFRERYSQFWGEKESENSRQTFGRLPYQLWNEKANDGEGAALLKSSHNGATGGYEESLAAVLAKHKHHLASTQAKLQEFLGRNLDTHLDSDKAIALSASLHTANISDGRLTTDIEVPTFAAAIATH